MGYESAGSMPERGVTRARPIRVNTRARADIRAIFTRDNWNYRE